MQVHYAWSLPCRPRVQRAMTILLEISGFCQACNLFEMFEIRGMRLTETHFDDSTVPKERKFMSKEFGDEEDRTYRVVLPQSERKGKV
jgi:hypothetical protein